MNSTSSRRTASVFCFALFLSAVSAVAAPCRVNVNTATPEQLQLLARTGSVLSSRIVQARPLDAEKLDAVKGIGPAWLSHNGPYVAYEGPTTCTEKVRVPKVVKPTPPQR